MTDQKSLEYTLQSLQYAQSQISMLEGLRTVKQNLQYVIDDVEQEIKLIKEKGL